MHISKDKERILDKCLELRPGQQEHLTFEDARECDNFRASLYDTLRRLKNFEDLREHKYGVLAIELKVSRSMKEPTKLKLIRKKPKEIKMQRVSDINESIEIATDLLEPFYFNHIGEDKTEWIKEIIHISFLFPIEKREDVYEWVDAKLAKLAWEAAGRAKEYEHENGFVVECTGWDLMNTVYFKFKLKD